MAFVVVVEDNESIRESLARALERAGHVVEVFPDSIPAMLSPRLQQADVIVTDLLMPSPAEELIRHVRGFSQPPPVIVMTGYLSEVDWVNLGEMGSAFFIEKPFNISELLATVDRAANGGRSPEAQSFSDDDMSSDL